ncbi:hypothetical protein VP01_3029g2 [Puccinia sorghi]|uniref:Uncharacterized protein n=1 Tax=Puccinia sorghi TaxID=27349 RepID=A0A0L6V041_9BASI|nr:hypothetical protein VP01_3029g2 [Puccinia sorghi]
MPSAAATAETRSHPLAYISSTAPGHNFMVWYLPLETALHLIAKDLNTITTNPLVYKTLEDSRTYGVAKFSDDAPL